MGLLTGNQAMRVEPGDGISALEEKMRELTSSLYSLHVRIQAQGRDLQTKNEAFTRC